MNHRREEVQMITVKTYRGHIRNWKELCAELEIDPALPREEKEQEILVKAYQKWGGEMADHIYGMFAFALWDEEEKKLFCLRDQFGTKPFYYYQTEDGELLYGTMIRDIIGQPGFKKELNEEMLQIYMSLTYGAGEDTFFKGLKKLLPGRYLIWQDGKLEIHRYWKPEFHPDESKTLEDWADEIHNTLKEIMPEVKTADERVESFLSGGVDSSVAAGLLSKAIGKQLTCVFVDHGLLRKNEGDEVEAVFGPDGPYDLNFIRVNAQERYYSKLAGVKEPEQKRKIIGEEFIRVFEEEAKKIGAVDFLVQGTIYPDVVESGLGGESAVIKSHHNVGGLPDCVDFKEIIEPLRDLFKDEVRKAGLEMGIPEYLVYRQPFPGPGLGIRIIGEVTAEKVKMVQDADAIYREEIANAGLDKTIGQYFAALTNMRSVGVMGDERTYDYAIALRAVNTVDFMTAEAAEIPYEVLSKVMSRIINEVRGVNRVMYDLTSKPPGTIEFE